MELGISTASLFQNASTLEAPALLKGMGVEKAEVFLNTFSEYEPAYISALRKQVDETGLQVYSIHPLSVQFEAQLFSIHPGQKADALALYRKILEGGKRLGATHYTMHGALQLSGSVGTVRNHRLDKLATVLDELLGVAEDAGMQLCLENVSWCCCNRPEVVTGLKERLGDGRLKFVLDIKQAVRGGQDPFAFIEAMGTDIANIHVCDYAYEAEGLKLKMPGDGAFDFAHMKHTLGEKGCKCPAFIEVYSDMYRNLNELEHCYRKLKTVLA